MFSWFCAIIGVWKTKTYKVSFLSKKNTAYLGLMLVTILWGSTFFLTKIGLKEASPIAMVFYRFALSTLFFAPILIWSKRRVMIGWPSGLLTGSILFLVFLFQNTGLQYTSASNSGFLGTLFIVFVPLLAFIILKTKFAHSQLIVLLLCVFGAWVLAGGIQHYNIGDGLSILSTLAYALYIVMVAKYSQHEDPLVEAFQQFSVVTVLSFIFMFVFHSSWRIGGIETGSIILYLAVFPGLFCFSLLNILEREVDPYHASLVLSLKAFIGPVFAWTLGGEQVLIEQLVGGGIILFALVLSHVLEHPIHITRLPAEYRRKLRERFKQQIPSAMVQKVQLEMAAHDSKESST